jgi:hypothetical protein
MSLQSDIQETFTPGLQQGLNKSMIELCAKETVSMIRRYSESQVELWKQVPSWALEADGRSGYNSCLCLAYERKLWTINHRSLLVDLNNGKLMGFKGAMSLECASDHVVLEYALLLDRLDASKILDELKKQSLYQPIASSNCMTNEGREAIRKRFGLAPVAI